jgi:serine/threonine-protein kinase PknK
MLAIPKRYEALRRLGQGGGGEVWAVRDRVSDRVLALKVLAVDAGEQEVLALVREAVALTALEGLGVPRVLAFGALLGGGPRYMLRELVEGESLDDVLAIHGGSPWIEPLVRVCEQLTVLHRSGLLHGDIKPANIICGSLAQGTLVDLGLAAPWREGGARAEGLTPKFAAPELMEGDRLTVRAEVYSLGATLGEALGKRGNELDCDVREELARIASRATQRVPTARYPSVDELASELCKAAGIAALSPREDAVWPVVGLDGVAQRLATHARALPPGGVLVLEGPAGSGRTTLARRVAWTLGVEGRHVAMIEAPRVGMTSREGVELELSTWVGEAGEARDLQGLVIVVDDVNALDSEARRVLQRAAATGACLVGVGTREEMAFLGREDKAAVVVFDIAPLEGVVADELVRRAMPSLPDALRAHLVTRGEGRPGKLRALVKRLARRVAVSVEDVEQILAEDSRPAVLLARTVDDALVAVERLLDMGRYDEALQNVSALHRPDAGRFSASDTSRIAIARARIALARGDDRSAATLLDAVEASARLSAHTRAWSVTRARVSLRAGAYADASRFADEAASTGTDGIAADALAAKGVALAYTGEDVAALACLERAVDVSRAASDRRAEGVALGSLAIAHQRAGRASKAREVYEAALAVAEEARDANTVAATRLNLAILAQGEGDLAVALQHLEATVDMGQRAGGLVAVQQALLNLANLDLYLGRYARASSSLESLARERDGLAPHVVAQLFGLQAELTTRSGDAARASDLYLQCARAWEELARPLDAAEARLESILARTRLAQPSTAALASELAGIAQNLGNGGFGEHSALAEIVRGTVASLAGDEATARHAYDDALAQAQKAGRREWAWRALDGRARLAMAQGSVLGARRDTEAALSLLEETAAKLPRDLREVFWNDPRRSALRQAHSVTIPVASYGATKGGSNPPPRSINGVTGFNAPRLADDRLARILELTRELARERDLPRLLMRITDHAVALLGAERGFVVLTGDDGKLETHVARHRSGDEIYAKFSRSVAEKVVDTGEPVVATSARDDARLAEAVSVHQLMIQSIACVPIRDASPAGHTIGALYVETRLRPGARFQDEMPTLCAFADQAAIAIESARLLQENRARADELVVANAELEVARAKLEEALGRRTEQLSVARRDLRQARAELRGHFGYGGLVGTSAGMRKLYALLERVKDADVPVLITGESGTGKEVVAKAIHGSGLRANAPFLGVNCGAIPENLLESELFGHVRGAFTGADKDRKGLFREAEGGTLLLDEIGEMPLKMQTGLLRVLQEKSVRAVGGTREEKVDVRVVAATNRDLANMVSAGLFREDLYYRLHVIEVRIPALRERIEDIPPLIDHFLTLFSARYRRDRKSLGREALRRLSAHGWPGNVRQLEHVLLNAWLMTDNDEIGAEDLELPDVPRHGRPMVAAASSPSLASPRASSLPKDFAPRASSRVATNAATPAEFKATERDRILSALTACNWNRVKAAEMIGVPRRTFYRRLKEFGIL